MGGQTGNDHGGTGSKVASLYGTACETLNTGDDGLLGVHLNGGTHIAQLRTVAEKDDVKEVAQGFECGISIEKFNDIKVGDFIESYQVEENKE